MVCTRLKPKPCSSVFRNLRIDRHLEAENPTAMQLESVTRQGMNTKRRQSNSARGKSGMGNNCIAGVLGVNEIGPFRTQVLGSGRIRSNPAFCFPLDPTPFKKGLTERS